MTHLTDEQIRKLLRGGHDSKKVYAAYKAAVNHKGQPTVILANTIKGYGLGEAGEGRNTTHQQKKLTKKSCACSGPLQHSDRRRGSRARPRSTARRRQRGSVLPEAAALGGLPAEAPGKAPPLKMPDLDRLSSLFIEAQRRPRALDDDGVRAHFDQAAEDPKIGKHIVPIIPDEARTFGMDGCSGRSASTRRRASCTSRSTRTS